MSGPSGIGRSARAMVRERSHHGRARGGLGSGRWRPGAEGLVYGDRCAGHAREPAPGRFDGRGVPGRSGRAAGAGGPYRRARAYVARPPAPNGLGSGGHARVEGWRHVALPPTSRQPEPREKTAQRSWPTPRIPTLPKCRGKANGGKGGACPPRRRCPLRAHALRAQHRFQLSPDPKRLIAAGEYGIRGTRSRRIGNLLQERAGKSGVAQQQDRGERPLVTVMGVAGQDVAGPMPRAVLSCLSMTVPVGPSVPTPWLGKPSDTRVAGPAPAP